MMDARTPDTPLVDIWVGLSAEVAEVDKAIHEATSRLSAVPMAEVMTAFERRQVVGLKLACEAVNDATAEIKRLVTQAENMSAHLAKVLAIHANRRPRP